MDSSAQFYSIWERVPFKDFEQETEMSLSRLALWTRPPGCACGWQLGGSQEGRPASYLSRHPTVLLT